MQSSTNPECIPSLEFPEIPNKDELLVSYNLFLILYFQLQNFDSWKLKIVVQILFTYN